MSEPIDSSTSMSAVNVVPRALTAGSMSEASSICSGRIPISTSPLLPSFFASDAMTSWSLSTNRPSGVSIASALSVPGRKFIDGEPMNPATNTLTGLS